MSDAAANKALIEQFWVDMGNRDFAAVRTYFTADSHYTDVPAPEEGARGPDEIEARLRLGIAPLERYVPLPGNMVAEGDMVILEHSEEWHWSTGESVVLPFVSVFEIHAGGVDRSVLVAGLTPDPEPGPDAAALRAFASLMTKLRSIGTTGLSITSQCSGFRPFQSLGIVG